MYHIYIGCIVFEICTQLVNTMFTQLSFVLYELYLSLNNIFGFIYTLELNLKYKNKVEYTIIKVLNSYNNCLWFFIIERKNMFLTFSMLMSDDLTYFSLNNARSAFNCFSFIFNTLCFALIEFMNSNASVLEF